MANPLKDATLDDLEDEIRRRRNSMKKTRRKKLNEIHQGVARILSEKYGITFKEEVGDRKWGEEIAHVFTSDDGLFNLSFRRGQANFYIMNQTSRVHNYLFDLADFVECNENSDPYDVCNRIMECVSCDDTKQIHLALSILFA